MWLGVILISAVQFTCSASVTVKQILVFYGTLAPTSSAVKCLSQVQLASIVLPGDLTLLSFQKSLTRRFLFFYNCQVSTSSNAHLTMHHPPDQCIATSSQSGAVRCSWPPGDKKGKMLPIVQLIHLLVPSFQASGLPATLC